LFSIYSTNVKSGDKNLKIVFAGTPLIAKVVLEKILVSGFSVDLVLTKPDSIAHRGKKLTPSVVKDYAASEGITVLTPLSLKKDLEVIEQIRYLQPDIMIVVAYGLILPPEVLTIPKLGCINIHVSLLPKHRGAAPIQRAILEGDKMSGITLIQMDRGLDTGDILLQQTVAIDLAETSGTLHDKLAIIGSEMLIEYLHNYKKIKAVSQNHLDATYANKIEKHEAKIDWNQDAVSIDRQIRAFNPFPIAFCYFNNELIKIWQAHVIVQDVANVKPGTITAVSVAGIVVATKSGFICKTELQLSGKKKVTTKEYLSGIRNTNLIGQKYV
jgi:methionyl-tRNA formyltransferase